jgi:hypothetical protein
MEAQDQWLKYKCWGQPLFFLINNQKKVIRLRRFKGVLIERLKRGLLGLKELLAQGPRTVPNAFTDTISIASI